MQNCRHGEISSVRPMPAGGSQGSTFGVLGYLSQSNDNADSVPVDERFKFMDDLTFLETVLLMNVGLASLNFRNHIPSNLPSHNQVIPSQNLKTQQYIDSIQKWTSDRMMVLNEKKTKNIIFNFSKERQFTTDIKLKNETLEVVNETKLLGVYITTDLRWNRNAEYLVKDANKRMRVLHTAAKFTRNSRDLLIIYKSFIRSKLDQSAAVWHSSLSKNNENDLERVQRSALKVILGEKYISYESALKNLNLESLYERREALCLKFAKKSLKLKQFQKMFPKHNNLHKMEKRNPLRYVVNNSNTDRYRRSAIPSMQRMLNEEDSKLKCITKNLDNFCSQRFMSCDLSLRNFNY